MYKDIIQCELCGKDIEARNKRKYCIKCGIKKQHEYNVKQQEQRKNQRMQRKGLK